MRCPNGLTVEWLTDHYRELVAKALDVPTTRVLFVKAGDAVELEPEPVEET